MDWHLYEVRRDVVADLERLPKRHDVAQASDSIGAQEPGASTETLTAPRPNEAEYSFEVSPHTLGEMQASLIDECSREFTPLGDDLATASLGACLIGGECYRRLLCLRFDVEYTPLPL